MAAVKTPTVLIKPEPWDFGCSDTSLFLSNPPHALDMSYQYMASPPTASNQAGIGITPPGGGYRSSFKLPSQDLSAIDADCKESDGSYEEHKAGDVLRRSFSTPSATQMQETPCHCRRRKIRCIASTEFQNRCVNCIRLKKECSFYPVDQQPGAESRSRGPPRQTAGSSVASTNSSPAVGTASPGEMTSHHHGHTSVSSKVQPCGDDFYSQDVKGHFMQCGNGNLELTFTAASQYAFANRPSSTKWMADASSASIPKPESINNMPWHSYAAESPISAQFSPYAQSSAASTTWVPELSSHDELAWLDFTPPARSMSLSGESTGSQPTAQYLSVGQGQPFDGRQSALSDMYPQHHFGQMAGMDGSGPIVAATLPSNAEQQPPWQQQQQPPQLLSQSQTPYAKEAASLFDNWQYDKADGPQQLWLDDQRPPSTAGQAPSEAYYSA
ncbi:hypothetical protein L249_3533 [Ophiocordyceps polyrhachis-furcata BCC 54312]|uniref:Zn(2)-C6 fungal-type domain-containing protein n=1 Tax=Ophiocordyceps polyrhachis-furcata BCC 54312 TaxID=1330021 RepID=A0A367LM88_9HYPO|nr:hypothetical protein L249_3533 [Ophiocordyceps polyrhachis-furcata BCC 54312]